MLIYIYIYFYGTFRILKFYLLESVAESALFGSTPKSLRFGAFEIYSAPAPETTLAPGGSGSETLLTRKKRYGGFLCT